MARNVNVIFSADKRIMSVPVESWERTLFVGGSAASLPETGRNSMQIILLEN